MSADDDFPALKLLLQAYLTLDWPDEYADPWAAVDDFAAKELEAAARIPHEVELALDGSSEDDLRRLILDELSSGYLPSADGATFRCWLREVASRVGRS